MRRRTSQVTRGKRAARGGFTLVEMLVALSAGLLITISVIALSRDATRTFHEEMRVSTAEMSLRLAAERLRSDLQRASFMSTPNIWIDRTVVRPQGPTSQFGTHYPQAIYPGLFNLSGIELEHEASSTGAVQTYSQTYNGLRPDAIRITGNMTTADEYVGRVVPGGGCASNGGVGDSVILSADDPAVMRLMTFGAQNAFMPARNASNVLIATQRFLARVSDPTGKFYNYVPVCNVILTNPPQIQFDFAAPGSVLTGQMIGTGSGGTSGFARVVVNPIHTVRWYIRRSASALLDDPGTDVNARFELVRAWVDSRNVEMPVVEVVAEYAIDLKFAFTVEHDKVNHAFTTFEFGDPLGYAYTPCTDVTGCAKRGGQRFLQPMGLAGPDSIRSVHFRLATRSTFSDRNTQIAGAPTGYVYRYCLEAASPCKRLVRARTIVSEVALPNQKRTMP